MGCGQDLVPELYLPPRWYKGGTPGLADQLRRYRPDAPHCRSLAVIADHCPRHRSLIFLVSDFHFPLRDTVEIFDSLLKHDVVPVVLWHPQEYQNLPNRGLVSLRDPETGEVKQLLMRPALKQKIIDSFTAKRERLKRLFMRYGRQPFFITEAFQADQMTRYFYEQ